MAQEYAAMSVVAEPKASKAMESMNPNPWIWILERKMKEMHLTNHINSLNNKYIYIYTRILYIDISCNILLISMIFVCFLGFWVRIGMIGPGTPSTARCGHFIPGRPGGAMEVMEVMCVENIFL